MGYSDKQMQLATQIAYMNFNNKDIEGYYDENGEYPTLQYMLTQSENAERIRNEFMKKYIDAEDGIVLERKVSSEQMWEAITNGTAECSNWRIAGVQDQNKENGLYACLIETSDNSAIIGFRGSESTDIHHFTQDWICADLGLLNNLQTEQQAAAKKYMDSIANNSDYNKYKNFAVTGHSLGGNLASYATISCNQSLYDRISQCISFDGPGFSTEFLEENRELIAQRSGTITHYQWSFVGGLLNQLTGENYQHIFTNDTVYGKYEMSSLLQKHDTCFIDFNSDGSIKDDATMDDFAKYLGQLSQMIDANTKDIIATDEIAVVIDGMYQFIDTLPETARDSMKYGAGVVVAQMFVNSMIEDPKGTILFLKGLYDLKKLVCGEYILPMFFNTVEFLFKNNLIPNLLGAFVDLTQGDLAGLRVNLYLLWNTAVQTAQYDPLIIDLGKDGFDVLSKENGVHFDLDGNGFSEKTSWTSKDGVLCLDLNGDGMIDNGKELFGDRTLLPDGSVAKNGFEALAQYDTDKNGVIDGNDDIFGKLYVWIDANADGISGEGELKTLNDLGITSINLNYAAGNTQLESGESIGNTATVTFSDGTISNIGELWVRTDLYDTTEKDVEGMSADIMALPDVRSIGNVHSLRNAMALDASGELQQLVESFLAEPNQKDRYVIIEKILLKLAGAENVSTTSRGSYFDGQKLAVLEAFMGQKFYGTNGSNPNNGAAQILKDMYNNLAEMYFGEMLKEGVLKPYLKMIEVTEGENGKKVYNTDIINSYLYLQLLSGAVSDSVLGDLAGYFAGNPKDIQGAYEIFYQMKNYFVQKDIVYLDKIDGRLWGAFKGDEKGNTISGNTRDNVLMGAAGNDSLSGDSGNDVLDGGSGDDFLSGGYDNDTYIFGLGYECDTIYDSSGTNRIKFQEGISLEDLQITTEGNYAVRLRVKGTADSIYFSDFGKSSEHQNFTLEFADGKVQQMNDETGLFKNLKGSEGADYLKVPISQESGKAYGLGGDDTLIGGMRADELYGGEGSDNLCGAEGNDLLYGGEGNDSLYGETGNDELYGESGYDQLWGGYGNDQLKGGDGNDSLSGEYGNDVLDGGAGDDFLNGGYDDDTYIFGLGYECDTIYDSSGTNRIQFQEGISLEDLQITTEGNYAVRLRVKGTADSIYFSDFGKSSEHQNFTLEFADGKVQQPNDETGLFKNLKGSEGADYLKVPISQESGKAYGLGGDDTLIGGTREDELYGGAGSDNLHGAEGNDLLYGGEGNDSLYGEKGDDELYGESGYDQLWGGYGNDQLKGGDGNDSLSGEYGNDVLDGGAGDDFLSGGYDNDTYIFGLGYECDTICDSSGTNRIKFQEGISLKDLQITTEGNYAVRLRVKGTADSIYFSDFRKSSEHQNFTLEFADGTEGIINHKDLVVEITQSASSPNTISRSQDNSIIAMEGISFQDNVIQANAMALEDLYKDDKLFSEASIASDASTFQTISMDLLEEENVIQDQTLLQTVTLIENMASFVVEKAVSEFQVDSIVPNCNIEPLMANIS